MKQVTYIRVILTTFGIAFCTLLLSQQTNIEFNKVVHDFGDIMLNSGKHACSFTFKNISKEPVVIQTVISSCGCAKPEWTKQPIMPGEIGKVDVTFLNDQGAYPFDKSLTVYITGEPRPVILRMKGVVHEKLKSLSELFPENFDGFSLRKSYIDFGNISKDQISTQVIEVANISKKKIEVTFSNLKSGLSVKPNPIILDAGKKEKLTLTINSHNSDDWGKTRYHNQITVNGKKINNKELKIYASLRDNFSTLTKEEKNNAPLPMASSSSFHFDKIKRGEQIKTSFRVRNLGSKDLLIRKVESNDSDINSNYPTKIAPGETGIIEITVNTTQNIGETTYLISVITNSPSRPVVNFVITGLID